MKSLLAVFVSIFLLIGLLFAVSAFLGRDILISLKKFSNSEPVISGQSNKTVLYRFAVISDTHSDSNFTERALKQARALGIGYIVHTGDWTTVGTLEELGEQKRLFDEANISYYGIMGDHDRWQSGARNFENVFGKIYESFDLNNIHHILLDASNLNEGLGKTQLDWLESDLERNKDKKILIFMHLPPYHPSSDRTISNKGGSNAVKESDTKRFLTLINGKNVLGIFSGDHHLSSSYTEPQTSVRIFISGAVTHERNLQSSRFSLVEVYDDYSIGVEDQIIK